MLYHTKRRVKYTMRKPYCYVCNRCLFSLEIEIEMAEKQENMISLIGMGGMASE